MNRRNKEFAEEVKQLLERILIKTQKEALEKGVSLYDIELDLKDVLQDHMTYRMIASETCALRHFENLVNRRLVLVSEKDSKKTVKLNPEFAGQDIDLMVAIFVMPRKT